MDLTARERLILRNLMDLQLGMTLQELESLLKVSRRTVYRELASLEEALAKEGVELVKPKNQGYQLIFKSKLQKDKIQEYLQEDLAEWIDIPLRQQAIALNILLADLPLRMEDLADEFQISLGTVDSDLKEISQSFKDYQFIIERKKSIGILGRPKESVRRQIAGSIIYNSVSEIDFFYYINHLEENNLMPANHYFLQMIAPDSWYMAKEALEAVSQDMFKLVNDNQIQYLITMLALSIDRLVQGNHLNETVLVDDILKSMLSLSHKVFAYLSLKYELSFDLNERHFLARLLSGVNYKESQDIFHENFDVKLSFAVKEFIKDVANQTGYDFSRDQRLYQDLMSHIQATLHRPSGLLEKVNFSVLENVLKQYPHLMEPVRLSFLKHFAYARPQSQKISKEELAYLMIHFASSLNRSPKRQKGLSALVICSSGIGSSQILESRIEREIPEIAHIEIIKASQLHKVNVEGFDLILSTIQIANLDQEYSLISPLLLDQEIQLIRESISQKDFQFQDHPSKDSGSSQDQFFDFDFLYEYMSQANRLLQTFVVESLDNSHHIGLTIRRILGQVSPNLVANQEAVSQAIIDRYELAPIGIPHSNMALFHASHPAIRNSYFAIYDLQAELAIKAMDGQDIGLKRILLLLGPDPLSDSQQRLLGRISQSVIENDQQIALFNQANYSEIYQFLSRTFIDDIRQIE